MTDALRELIFNPHTFTTGSEPEHGIVTVSLMLFTREVEAHTVYILKLNKTHMVAITFKM